MLQHIFNVETHNYSSFKLGGKVARSRGFSLIEIMVTLAIFALVATLAVPNIRNFVQNNQMGASANNLMGSLALARSEAIKRNIQVSVCASSTQTGCTGADWNNGWIVFVDRDNPGVVDDADEILSAVQGLPGGMDLSSTDPYIQFKPNGSLAACQYCVLDFYKYADKFRIVSLFEDVRSWATRAMYLLLPGKDVHAMMHCGKKMKFPCPEPPAPATPPAAAPPATPPPAAPAIPPPAPANVASNAGIEMTICNSQKVGEKGFRIYISVSGHISKSKFVCN